MLKRITKIIKGGTKNMGQYYALRDKGWLTAWVGENKICMYKYV